MKRPSLQSPNVVLVKLPCCEDTSDQVIRDIVEGQADATRKAIPKEKPV